MRLSSLGLAFALGFGLSIPALTAQDVSSLPANPNRPAFVENSYIVHFQNRSFDLVPFRNAVHARRPAHEVAAIVERMERAVRADQAGFVAAVQGIGGVVREQWWIIDAACVDGITPNRVGQLAALPNVARIERNAWYYAVNNTARNALHHEAAQANLRRNAQNELVTGDGVSVAILDTGSDRNWAGSGKPHPGYFIGGSQGNTQGGGLDGSRLMAVFGTSGLGIEDLNGHGTHVAGSSGSDAAAYRGMAPGVGIVGIKVANDGGGAQGGWIVSGWQTVAAQRVALNIGAANNSFTGSPSLTDAIQMALDNTALNADVVICCAAGNSGNDTTRSQNVWNGLAVGSIDKNSLVVSSFSGRGPLDNFGRTYPDITAVGRSVTSMLRDGAGATGTGTSMASPMGTGGAALVRDANTSLTALEAKAILLNNTKHTQNRRNSYGLGVLDCDESVQQAIADNVFTKRMHSGSRVFNKGFTATATGNMRITATWMHPGGSRFDDFDLRIYDGATLVASDLNTLNSYEHVDFAAQAARSYRLELTWAGNPTANDRDVAIAGIGPGDPVFPPTITSISPTSTTNSSTSELTIVGTNLDSVTLVTVGPMNVTNLTVVDATTLKFRLPIPAEIARHNVTATNAGGTSNAVNLDVNGTHPIQLSTPSTFAVRGFGSNFNVIGDKNWQTLMFASNSNTPSAIPGIVNLGIGANFTLLFQIGDLPHDTRGAASMTLTWPTTIPAGSWYIQCLTYDPSNITLPIESSNVLSMTLF